MEKRSGRFSLSKIPVNIRGFGLRMLVFLFVAYVLGPWLFSLIESENLIYAKYTGYHIIPFSLLGLLLFVLLSKDKIRDDVAYRQNWIQTWFFALGSIFFFLAYLYTGRYIQVTNAMKYPFATNFFLSYMSIFLAASCVFIAAFNWDFVKNYAKQMIIPLLSLPLFLNFTIILNQYWPYLSRAVAWTTYKVLGLFHNSVHYVPNFEPDLAVGDFSVRIGAPCSGMESLMMFAVLFSIALAYDWHRIKGWKALLIFPIGLIGMFAVNITRITVLMFIGIRWPDFAVNQFHTNAGWILFSLYFVIFFNFAYGWMLKKNGEK